MKATYWEWDAGRMVLGLVERIICTCPTCLAGHQGDADACAILGALEYDVPEYMRPTLRRARNYLEATQCAE